MKKEPFYAGHSFEWIDKFVSAVPKTKGNRRDTAFCIAAAIQHQYTCTKQTTIKLDSKLLENFCINRRQLNKYLSYFQDNELLTFFIKKGKTPVINLLYLPLQYSNIIKKKEKKIKEYIFPVATNQTVQVHRPNSTGSSTKQYRLQNSQKSKARNLSSKTTKTREQGKGARQPRQGSKGREQDNQGKEPSEFYSEIIFYVDTIDPGGFYDGK